MELAKIEPIEDRARDLLIELGLITETEPVFATPLAGGVSSDIARVSTPAGDYCVKFALPQLKVKAVWTAPVGRNLADYEWLNYAGSVLPGSVPRLYGRSERLGGFAMAYLDPGTHANWKSELLAGQVDVEFAGAVGEALAMIHAYAAARPDDRAAFDNKDDFAALRLDPYLATTAERHPDLAPVIRGLIELQTNARISLVHGDVSPKNILKGPGGPVILDAECATDGDPAFDVAFCLNHLLIKATAAIASPEALERSALALWSRYAAGVDWEDRAGLERRVAALLPALMLARVDGKSPVEYLDEPNREKLRQLSRGLVDAAPQRIEEIVAAARRAGAGV